MQFPFVYHVPDHVAEILEQRVAVDAHHRKHPQREQRYRHDNNADGSGHRDHHQLRISQKRQKNNRFYGISRFQHPAKDLTRVRIIGRYGINV